MNQSGGAIGYQYLDMILWNDIKNYFDDYAGGHLYRYNPKESNKRVKLADMEGELEDLGIPLAKNSVYALTVSPAGDEIYGLTYPDGHFFIYDISRGKFKDLGPIDHEITFHGPVVTTLGTITKKSQNALYSAVTAADKIRLVPKNEVVIQPGSASGPLAGGNLTTLCHLLGTPYTPHFKDCILMLEDIGEPAYRIDRMLSQMKLCGCFDGISGLALGAFKDCGNKSGIYKVVADMFADQKIPILAGFEVGHGRTNMTFPIGLEATLDTNRCLLSFHSAATTPE